MAGDPGSWQGFRTIAAAPKSSAQLPIPLPTPLPPAVPSPRLPEMQWLQFVFILGEKITVELQSTEKETAELLSRVLNGNMLASEALAKVVHEDVDLTDPTLESLEISIPQEILGIWVDPIGKCRATPCAFSHSF